MGHAAVRLCISHFTHTRNSQSLYLIGASCNMAVKDTRRVCSERAFLLLIRKTCRSYKDRITKYGCWRDGNGSGSAADTLCQQQFEWPLLAQKVISDWKWTVSTAAAQKMSGDDCFLLASVTLLLFQGGTPRQPSKKWSNFRHSVICPLSQPFFAVFSVSGFEKAPVCVECCKMFACRQSGCNSERKYLAKLDFLNKMEVV